MSALGREAAACPAFRWLPGMLMRTLERTRGDQSRTVIECAYRLDGCETLYKESDILANEGRHHEEPDEEVIDRWPDLDDGQTLGAIAFALLPRAWSDPFISCIADGDGSWRIVGSHDYAGLYGYQSRAHAIVAALKAAPEARS